MSTLANNFYAGLLKLLALLPLRLARALGQLLELLLRPFGTALHQTTRINLQHVRPQLGEQELLALVNRSVASTLVNALEMPIIWRRSNDWLAKQITGLENPELMQQLVAEGKGVIAICPHVGNWEVFGRQLSHYGPTTSLYQAPKIAALETIVREGREKSGATLVPTSQRGIAALLKALKRGEIIGMLPDQVPKKNAGIFAPFFGVQALTMTLVHNLVRRTGCKVVLGYAIREAGGFRILFKAADDAIYSDDERTSVTALNQLVERSTEEDFSQYQWAYKRFRRQPDGVSLYPKSDRSKKKKTRR